MLQRAHTLVKEFIDSGYQHMSNIAGNRVFYTDSSCSTLVWCKENVVIEYYMIYPNVDIPLHWHPFNNQMIFIGGELTGRRTNLDTGVVSSRRFTDANANMLVPVLPPNVQHGFSSGPLGARLYNIQIWDQAIVDPISAAIEYLGPTMGPIHTELISSIITT